MTDNDIKCKECEYLMFSDCYGECSKAYKGIVNPDDSCGKGKRKIKDNDIIKALGLCTQDHCYTSECPIFEGTSSVDCRAELIKKCNDLINHQKAEIERLHTIINCYEETSGNKKARAEATTEFAERLKEKIKVCEIDEPFDIIDQIAKELKGEQ